MNKTSMKVKNWNRDKLRITKEQEQKILQEKGKNLFDNVCLIDVCVDVIKNALAIGVVDIPKLIGMKAKVSVQVAEIDRICNRLRQEISKVVILDPAMADFMSNEHNLEVYRLMKLMAFMNTEDLRNFVDIEEERYKEFILKSKEQNNEK